MTIRQTIGLLKSQGYEVTYRTRSDGGVLITSINGQKFSGAKGNILARNLTGQTLTDRRRSQLAKITKARKHYRTHGKIATTEDLEKYRKRVMRKWKKAGLTGSISKYNLRKMVEDRGLKGAETYLEEMERHTENKAYIGQLEALYSRIDQDIVAVQFDTEEVSELEKLKDVVKQHENDITPEQIFKIFDWLYDWEHMRIEKAEVVRIRTEELLS